MPVGGDAGERAFQLADVGRAADLNHGFALDNDGKRLAEGPEDPVADQINAGVCSPSGADEREAKAQQGYGSCVLEQSAIVDRGGAVDVFPGGIFMESGQGVVVYGAGGCDNLGDVNGGRVGRRSGDDASRDEGSGAHAGEAVQKARLFEA